jgi:cytochrome P450
MAYTPPQPGFEDGIIHANDQMHAKLRRMYGVAFTPKAIEANSELLLHYGNLFIAQIKKAAGVNPVQDISQWLNSVTFDVVSAA